jgi:hypothetical protein
MGRHSAIRTVGWSILFGVCFGVFNSLGGPAVAGEQGTPRPSYPSGFAPGTRVVLLEENVALDPGLRAGLSGTIIGCDAADCSGSILVSWDLYGGGRDELDRCVMGPIGLYPPGSTAWVDPTKVKLGLPFDKTGDLQEDPDGCVYFTTDDGGMYFVVEGVEFGQEWLMPDRPNYVRLRGLLNRSPDDPKVKRSCPQRDGDLYHPIVSGPEWEDAPCCDKWVCGFGNGDRVVLTSTENPYGATDLPRGTSGTIICCRGNDDRAILVSWDLWHNGGDKDDYMVCTERLAGVFPPRSSWWVSVHDVAKYFESRCGVLQEVNFCEGYKCMDLDFTGLCLVQNNRDVYYLPDAVLPAPLPAGQYRATGLCTIYHGLLEGWPLTPSTPGPAGLRGVIFHSLLLPCPQPSSCEPPYVPGDRVKLLVDLPGGAPNLFAGATGDVICVNAEDPIAPIFVSWDDWTDGENEEAACDTRATWYPEHSAWWMACTEISRLVQAELYDAGPEFRDFAPQTVVAGAQTLRITSAIGNNGGVLSKPFYIDIYASVDKEITADDFFLWSVGAQIDAGMWFSVSWEGVVPTTVPAGQYYIGWLIDPDNRVVENDETNNTAVIESKRLTVKSQ